VAAVCSATVCREVREWARVACGGGSEAARASLGLAGGSGNELEKEMERERKKERGKELRLLMEGAGNLDATGWGTYRTGEGISVKGEDATIVLVGALVFDV
jgi:hypothetical protein